MASTLREARSQWFVLSDSPGIAYPAVTAPTLAILLLTVISDPVSTNVAFAIDAAGTCTLQDREGHLDTLERADDGAPSVSWPAVPHLFCGTAHVGKGRPYRCQAGDRAIAAIFVFGSGRRTHQSARDGAGVPGRSVVGGFLPRSGHPTAGPKYHCWFQSPL